ncbi:MAG: helix-turn-helix transcriptional regulator [FCB group bacterium]|nr:helix-turn-helix transcriptional regulator [FCB group bacterium]
MTKETLGQMIFRLRTEKKIGVRELGRRVEVTGVHISAIEKNKAKPSPELLRKIAEVLEIDVDRLMVRADQIDPEVLKVIKGNSYAVHDFLRTAKGLKKDQWEELKKEAQKMLDKSK